MEFSKRSAVVSYCIRLHNYCTYLRIELDDKLTKRNRIIELIHRKSISEPIINKGRVPIDNLHWE